MSDRLVTIAGKEWLLRHVTPKAMQHKDHIGECDPPDTTGKEIRILRRLKGEEHLEVSIHEMLHAANFGLKEEVVDAWARDVARVLTLLGYERRGS